MTAYGARIGYYRGDIKLLLEDAQCLHPTYFPMVPRLMNRLYAGVKGKVKGSKVRAKIKTACPIFCFKISVFFHCLLIFKAVICLIDSPQIL